MKSFGQLNWWPTEASFNQDPRSAEIREISIQALNAAEAGFNSGGEDPEALEAMFQSHSQLLELGIIPGMHALDPEDPECIDKQAKLIDDPVLWAEFAAGDLCNVIQRFAKNLKPFDPAILAEHDVLESTNEIGLHLMDTASASPRMKSFVIDMGLLSLASINLDADGLNSSMHDSF